MREKLLTPIHAAYTTAAIMTMNTTTQSARVRPVPGAADSTVIATPRPKPGDRRQELGGRLADIAAWSLTRRA